MKDFTVSVQKQTDVDLMRRACESTFVGKSHASLSSIYKAEHSPARTQLFWIELKNIPLFVSTHLLRHHVGSVPYQLTCRDDRKGGNPGLPGKVDEIVNQLEILSSEFSIGGSYRQAQDLIRSIVSKVEWLKDNTDRQTPVNLSLLVNAQSLIDMAKLRLCNQAHAETIAVFKAIKEQVAQVDPELAKLMVPKCVYRNGLCGEPRCCGYNHTPKFREQLKEYTSQFTEKQKGQNSNNVNEQ